MAPVPTCQLEKAQECKPQFPLLRMETQTPTSEDKGDNEPQLQYHTRMRPYERSPFTVIITDIIFICQCIVIKENLTSNIQTTRYVPDISPKRSVSLHSTHTGWSALSSDPPGLFLLWGLCICRSLSLEDFFLQLFTAQDRSNVASSESLSLTILAAATSLKPYPVTRYHNNLTLVPCKAVITSYVILCTD